MSPLDPVFQARLEAHLACGVSKLWGTPRHAKSQRAAKVSFASITKNASAKGRRALGLTRVRVEISCRLRENEPYTQH